MRANTTAVAILILGQAAARRHPEWPSAHPEWSSARFDPTDPSGQGRDDSLAGSTRDIRGIDLPQSFHTQRLVGFDLLEPREGNILVPGRRSIQLLVRSLTIMAMNGVVEAVYIRRPIQLARSFKEVAADLRQTLQGQEIQPGRLMRRQMKTWPDDMPNIKGHLFPVAQARTAIHEAFGDLGSVYILMYHDADVRLFYLFEISSSSKANDATRIIDPDSPKQAIAVRGPEAGRLSGIPAPTDRRIPLHGASLRLPGTAKDISGLDVPPNLIAGNSGTAGLARPHALTIQRSHAKPLSLLRARTSVTIRDGAVQDVTLVRPLLSSPFQKAIEDIVDAVQAEDADPAMAKALTAHWSEESCTREFRTMIRGVFAELEADIHMKKDSDTGGWSYAMTFRPTAGPDPAHRPADERPRDRAKAERPATAGKKSARLLEGRLRTALPRVSLHLPGTTRQVEGVDVPADVLAGKPGRADIDHPHLLTIERANGKPIAMPARATAPAFRGGAVASAAARCPSCRCRWRRPSPTCGPSPRCWASTRGRSTCGPTAG